MKRYISLSLTILCVVFIYCNSLMNANISTAQSGFVLKLLQKIVEVIGISPDLITDHIVRKLAHFCEYALLGFLLTATIRHWYGGIKVHIFMMLFFGLFVPFSDEFLQLFIDGRAGLVQDIGLDFVGFIAGMIFCISMGMLQRYCKKTFTREK